MSNFQKTWRSAIYEESEIIENHLHNYEKWFGAFSGVADELHVAERMGGGILPFTLTSGNDDFGSWVQVFGSTDTPIVQDKTHFDFHRCLITGTNSTATFIIQIVSGESSEIADKLTAEDFNEFPYISSSNSNDSGISEVIDKRCAVGEKIWMRACCIGQDAKTISLYNGIHEYDY
jgi:hypothetical protein